MSTVTPAIQQAADAIYRARENRTPIARVSETFGIQGAVDAYAVSDINTRRDLAAGRRLSGRKIGLTSKVVQQQLGVDQPDYGVLFGDMEFIDGDDIPTGRLMQPKAEGEIAFVVGRDLDDRCITWGRFLLAMAYALPAIEIVDSAILDWKITLVDTVADNASSGLYVLGTNPVPIGTLPLGLCGMDFRQNGHTVSVGSGVACMGHPLRAAFWLAKTMVELGQPLRAGDVVMSGALGPMFTFKAGDELSLSIGGVGSVRCRAA